MKKIKLTEFLIDNNANIHTKTGYDKMTPLMYAVQNNNQEAVHLLLKKGASFEEENKQNLSKMLLSAAQNNNVEIIKKLLESVLKNAFLLLTRAKTSFNVATNKGFSAPLT